MPVDREEDEGGGGDLVEDGDGDQGGGGEFGLFWEWGRGQGQCGCRFVLFVAVSLLATLTLTSKTISPLSSLQNENGTHPSIPFTTGLRSDVKLTRTLLLTIQDRASSNDPLPNNSHHPSKRSKTKEPPPDDDHYSKHVDDMNHFENYSGIGDANVPDDKELFEETQKCF